MKKGDAELYDKAVYRVRTSRKFYFPVYVMMAVLSLVIIYLRVSNLPIHPYALYGFVIFILICIKATEIHRFLSYYEITPNSIIRSKGILRNDITRIYMNSVTDLVLKQGIFQRLFNFGTIKVHRFTEGAIFEIKNINRPGHYLNIMEHALDKNRR